MAALLWCAAVIGGLAAVGVSACYVRGLRRLAGHPQGRSRVGRTWALIGGVVVTLIVTTPPVGELLEHRLSTHMVQHMTLIVVAAPLLAVSGCGLPLLAGLPNGVRRPVVRLQHRLPGLGVAGPHLAWAAQIGALWLWHLPAPYDEAVRSTAAHVTEHACFLLTAWVFWWYLLGSTRRRLRGPAAVLYLVAAIPPGAALGALLTFASHPLYPAQSEEAAATGADPLADQRLAGLVMWVPLDFLYVAVAVALVAVWMRAMQRQWPEPAYHHIPDTVTDQSPMGVSR